MKKYIIELFYYFRRRNLLDKESNIKLVWLHIQDTTKKS